MNDFSDQSFEAELQRLRPTPPPPELMAALERVPHTLDAPALSRREPSIASWIGKCRFWLLVSSAAALVIAFGIIIRQGAPSPHPGSKPIASAPPQPLLEANQVEIDRHLITAFDAVATLPSGEPIRFQCREWMDEIVLRDPARGLVIERQAPRLEVIPVKFETY
jgi:hypothetical protein